ncbi:MAG TPA: AbrB/MazE/SpoVT family DNA-binding domain-containing protein [Vicinamibacterales bacterium]|jgi:AbrB family looped-hinge helix DNA binding protein
MRLTSKGQVTIPQAIREKLGLLPLSEVEFDIVGDSVRIRKKTARAGRGRGHQMLEAMKRAPRPAMTTDELMQLTRGE